MQIGAYTLSSIHTGYLWLDGGAMFGTVPKVLWEKPCPPDAQNRIQLAMRALLIQSPTQNILVDCGLGDKGGEKFKAMFNVDQDTHNLEASLAQKGLSPSDITDVILTHLHFDHAGGVTRLNPETQRYELTFPKATVHIQAKNLQVAKQPNARERASYLPDIYQALEREGCLRLWEGPSQFLPGIDLHVSFGHTEAQQHPFIHDETTALFYGGDLVPMRAHVPLPWVMGYDLHPLTIMEEKQRALDLVAKHNGVLFFEHDPVVAACTLESTAKGYVIAQELAL